MMVSIIFGEAGTLHVNQCLLIHQLIGVDTPHVEGILSQNPKERIHCTPQEFVQTLFSHTVKGELFWKTFSLSKRLISNPVRAHRGNDCPFQDSLFYILRLCPKTMRISPRCGALENEPLCLVK